MKKRTIIQDKTTPKPAIWEQFPFLERYYGGVRALVPKRNNKPEYPSDGDELTVPLDTAAPDPETQTNANDAKSPGKRSLHSRSPVPDGRVRSPELPPFEPCQTQKLVPMQPPLGLRLTQASFNRRQPAAPNTH